MSILYYFASDSKLDEKPNPYIKRLSINDALELGVEINLDMFGENFDRDKPNVILYCEDEEKMSYPNIFAFDKNDYYVEIGTNKKFCTELEWDCPSEEKLEFILQYIHSQLKNAKEIEIWQVWLGDFNIKRTAKKVLCSLNDLSIEVLRKFYENREDNKCMIIK